jgi:hypothetical protein
MDSRALVVIPGTHNFTATKRLTEAGLIEGPTSGPHRNWTMRDAAIIGCRPSAGACSSLNAISGRNWFVPFE